MAYADKITTMRRMALIYPKSNIVWEGVNIDGRCLLRNYNNGSLIVLDEDKIKDFCEEDFENPLECKYQDKEGEDSWEPRDKDSHKNTLRKGMKVRK